MVNLQLILISPLPIAQLNTRLSGWLSRFHWVSQQVLKPYVPVSFVVLPADCSGPVFDRGARTTGPLSDPMQLLASGAGLLGLFWMTVLIKSAPGAGWLGIGVSTLVMWEYPRFRRSPPSQVSPFIPWTFSGRIRHHCGLKVATVWWLDSLEVSARPPAWSHSNQRGTRSLVIPHRCGGERNTRHVLPCRHHGLGER